MEATSARVAPLGVVRLAGRGAPAQTRSPILIAAWLALAYLAMPPVYAMAAFHGFDPQLLKPQVERHILFNCTANAAVMLSVRGLSGRLDQRLSTLSARVLLFHGVLAFAAQLLRSYYSNTMLVTGVGASLVLGALVILVEKRIRPVRIGALGPWHPILAEVREPLELIASPEADVGGYDLLVTTFVGGLSPEWTPALSRALLAGRPVRHAAAYVEEARGVVSIEHFDVGHVPEGGLTSYRLRKRALDVLFVVVTAPVALLLLAAGALLVRLTMGAPVFFVQPRVGQEGRVFSMIKLRTMARPSGPAASIATARGDSRITPCGRWLRRFHIDEIPQLLNVLAGHMSLVGPRPEQPALAADYARQIPAFAYRQMVRPGVTGWAQVRAGYAADAEETRVKLGYDLFYLKNFSLALDLQIIARTFIALARARGVR